MRYNHTGCAYISVFQTTNTRTHTRTKRKKKKVLERRKKHFATFIRKCSEIFSFKCSYFI